MLRKLLIANRGEIACRIIRTARSMGIRTVAVYSDADRHAQHVHMADESIYLGPAPSAESYLVIDKIIAAAKLSGADAIHPGYGFLSENEDFADACASNQLIFVGPPTSAIAAMGSKSAAKAIMSEAGVPLVPGYHGSEQGLELLQEEAQKIGFPVLLKAAYGGGGKGMRVVESANQFAEALSSAKREAQAAFGNDKMLIEKFIGNPRHVEIQVFCDEHGNAVYLAERDCSVQRRHQKVIEEAPAPSISSSTRIAMGEAAVRAAQAIDYVGAGTVEFLLDTDNKFYFMEMNTRLQVEHPVTEMVTGQDLVAWQLLVAGGAPLPLSQDQIQITGHSFEARIYAEDPDHEFLPSTGTLHVLKPPSTNAYVRIDSGVVEGDEVSSYYDPMIAKLVVWGEDRAIALGRLIQALNDYQIAGVRTNIDFLRKIAGHQKFAQADLTTRFIEKYHTELFPNNDVLIKPYAIMATLAEMVDLKTASAPANPWTSQQSFRLNQPRQFALALRYADDLLHIELTATATGWQATDDSDHWLVEKIADKYYFTQNGRRFSAHIMRSNQDILVMTERACLPFTRHLIADTLQQEVAAGNLTAPMNGTVVQVMVAPGDSVEAEQALIIMEAMKMEYTIRAPQAGVVEQVFYQAGDLVSDGAELLSLADSE
ncbi:MULTISPECIES: acetyl/propionyl/methylcrotonyl-CoA carboxylase subunit alpha [Pseudidiomarina]|uniref:Biotin carboxylase n=2 Tax=Pseudidiomarina TaxID=2800384 RepID=A0A368V267_9GAMM|nr:MULTISPECIES: acetyl/propionyl/methylcrotonyl-CoA carboxylase subunit alpha [Pseudidiomarina]PWW14365.1 3-methylcrotonyl-CoA carboxylase alpha subunit [Pseudidiomarina maritima]RBP92635.1 3-methylcrotonyl-CoA carboxylase alpha subunit [Pseudidiomarina tainanensis]RCW34445.1 3-methylcrotonyl-CoA carboxylase alpha subunit [Pseudidiomarina tainanensis]